MIKDYGWHYKRLKAMDHRIKDMAMRSISGVGDRIELSVVADLADELARDAQTFAGLCRMKAELAT